MVTAETAADVASTTMSIMTAAAVDTAINLTGTGTITITGNELCSLIPLGVRTITGTEH